MKKVLALILVIVMGLSLLAGCKGNAGGQGGKAQGEGRRLRKKLKFHTLIMFD